MSQDGHQPLIFMLAGPIRYAVKGDNRHEFEQRVIVRRLDHPPPVDLSRAESRPHIADVYCWLMHDVNDRPYGAIPGSAIQFHGVTSPVFLPEQEQHHMANRRFEMYQYRQVIVRMRLGESDRAIAQSGLMGRKKARSVRELANTRGWLNPDNDIPPEAELAACFDQSHARPQTTSLVEPHAEEVKKWAGLGIQGTTIYQALVRK
jgi:hypothetical protein